MTDHTDQTTMRDPLTQYPRPDFEKQPQPAPGLAREMRPKPDHGEQSYRGSGRLTGRRALITGADSGIGRAVAIAFAREGADLALNYLPSEEADAREVVELVEAAGHKAIALPGDIGDEAFCQRLVDEAVANLGGLDILVNVAGKQVYVEKIADLPTEQLEATFRTNVFAMFWLCKAALPHLPPGATIINTTSIQSYQPSGGLLDYASTKAANHRLHARLRQAGDRPGRARQRGGAGADLDPAAAQRRPAPGKGRGVRLGGAHQAPWAAGRARTRLRAAGLAGIELRDRRGVRRDRRQSSALSRGAGKNDKAGNFRRVAESTRPARACPDAGRARRREPASRLLADIDHGMNREGP